MLMAVKPNSYLRSLPCCWCRWEIAGWSSLRAEFTGEFERTDGGGAYGGKVEQEIDYLQLDYIANRYLTVTAGRFLTPFGIYNERLYPIWIRSLQPTPLIFPLGTGSSDGVMLRGGFSLNPKVNLNYATYFSTLSTMNKFESDRTAGGRVGFFLPGPRIEVGASFQKELQEERANAFGFHFAWQPSAIPLNLRSEYARSHDGSGYWIEAAYRLSQVPFWQKAMRRTEIVGRGQQLFAGEIDEDEAEEYGLPDVNTRQGDFGLNYYIRDGLKASASYSRRFNSDGNVNLWTVGLAYRFAFPLGRVGTTMNTRVTILTAVLALVSSAYAADPPRKSENDSASIGTPVARSSADADAMRVQGEQRFRANCGRCHAAPQKFPPRMMATIVRHMRVRATITDEDMRLVLFYMTQ